MAFTSMERSLRRLQDENNELVERWMKRKSQDADKLNAENDALLRKKQDKLKRDIQEASKEHVVITSAEQ